jgi:hypothetical protein
MVQIYKNMRRKLHRDSFFCKGRYFLGNKAKKGAENFDFCQIYDIFAPST